MTAADDEDLAQEYVLGTLTAQERAAFELSLRSDAALRARVADLERQLAPLAISAKPETPSADLWHSIESALGADVVVLQSRLRRWKIATGAAMAMAASLAGVLVSRPPPPAQSNYVAVVNRGGDLPALIVRVDVASGAVFVRPVSMVAPSDRSMELWYIPEGEAPKSLGTFGDEARKMPMPVSMKSDMRAPIMFAVSLEPMGGSPTGGPTGPVVYTGKLIAD